MRQHVSVVPNVAQQDRQQSVVAGALRSDTGPSPGNSTRGCLPQPEFHHVSVATARVARQRVPHQVLRHSI